MCLCSGPDSVDTEHMACSSLTNSWQSLVKETLTEPVGGCIKCERSHGKGCEPEAPTRCVIHRVIYVADEKGGPQILKLLESSVLDPKALT